MLPKMSDFDNTENQSFTEHMQTKQDVMDEVFTLLENPNSCDLNYVTKFSLGEETVYCDVVEVAPKFAQQTLDHWCSILFKENEELLAGNNMLISRVGQFTTIYVYNPQIGHYKMYVTPKSQITEFELKQFEVSGFAYTAAHSFFGHMEHQIKATERINKIVYSQMLGKFMQGIYLESYKTKVTQLDVEKKAGNFSEMFKIERQIKELLADANKDFPNTTPFRNVLTGLAEIKD